MFAWFMSMVRSLGASSPESTLTRVDLPAPLVPMTACTAPRLSSSDTLSMAVRPPKRRVMFWADNKVCVMVLPLLGRSRRDGLGTTAIAQLFGKTRQALGQDGYQSDDGQAEG